jgi:Ca2+-binding EF-hand superfamily protein
MDFIEGLCKYSIVTSEETKIRSGERFSIEQVSAELQRQLVIEAKNYSKDKNKPDYKTVFEFFDVNKNGFITADEFKSVLIRLQLTSRLPDSLVPELIKLISKGKKEIKLEDLIAFAEKGSKKETSEEVDDKDDKEDEDDIEDMTSNVPPAVITQNKDCDWLLWFLYRQSLKVDPIDPESIITELEIRCNETELTQADPAISVKELWNHLFELNLQGNMTQPQFLKGVQLVCRDSSGRDDDRVDYNALAKYVVRMGRAYNAAVQKRTKEDEGKFGPLLLEIKKFFRDIAEEKVDGKEPKPGSTRFEKLFHRLDSDKDGMLTVKEFKICLKRLQFKNVKSWSLRLIRRLFDECDKNKDGLLAIQEFSNYIQEKDDNVEKSKERTNDSNKTLATINNTKIRLNNLSDDEEDDVFRKNSRLTDNQLICKVNDLLMDVVPIDPNRPDRHGEVVRNSVRRFFHRADPERRGVVSEERFRAFLRRSGLQDVLTATELRRLTDKFKKRGIGGAGTGNGIQNDVLIDYELLCQQLHFTAETIPKSKAEVIFTRLQEAASVSVNAGRPFLSLCSLVDLKLTGRITKDELLHITKMLNCPLKREEVDAMMELFPNHALGKDNTIDYRVVHDLLESYTPRFSKVKDIDPYFPSSFGKQTGGISDSKVDGKQRVNPLDISTPHGFKISAPASQQSSSSSSGRDGSDFDPRYAAIAAAVGHDNKSSSDTTLQMILKNVKEGIEQKSRNWGSPYSIRKQFQAFDSNGSLVVSLKIFQGVVGELSVNLSPADLKTISTLFGVSDDNKINYDLFCSVLEGTASSSSSSSSGSNKDGNKESAKDKDGGGGGKDKNKDKDGDNNKPSGSSKERIHGPRTYLNPRVLQRYSELVTEGNHPRDIFIAQDLDRSGMVGIIIASLLS